VEEKDIWFNLRLGSLVEESKECVCIMHVCMCAGRKAH
jgi:hypothetical protein